VTEPKGGKSGLVRSLVIVGTDLVLLVSVDACGTPASVDEASTRACHLLANAKDDVSKSVYSSEQDGKSSAGSQLIRDAMSNYPVPISKGADEALSAPADVSSSFQEAARDAWLYKQAMEAGVCRCVLLVG
jgi:hypothetical protein